MSIRFPRVVSLLPVRRDDVRGATVAPPTRALEDVVQTEGTSRVETCMEPAVAVAGGAGEGCHRRCRCHNVVVCCWNGQGVEAGCGAGRVPEVGSVRRRYTMSQYL